MIAQLGPIRQIAFLTRDIQSSMSFYLNLGVGPWFYGDSANLSTVRYRGNLSKPEFQFAVAAWNELQIELIQPIGDGPSVVHEWKRRDYDRQLQHHVAVWPENLEKCLFAAQSSGFEVVQDGSTATGRFLYLANPAQPEFFLEITHATPSRQAFSRHVIACAASWDGARPVRPYGVID